ncbi:MAG: BspA family leucine-rich repeat surface protein [Parcubacteria group bacterium]|nr:BspA family leucine-rich repeat surface protein [Parcubacteria group bacterium]
MNRWNTGNVTNMAGMFRDTPNFNAPIGSWDTSKVTSMHAMFNNATIFNQDIGNWQTGNVINMSNMFSGATKFNQDIKKWQTGKVINTAGMFMNTSFNQDISNWNTNSFTNMGYMFKGAVTFNQPIGSWNVSKVYNMDRLFENAAAFNQPLGSWNLSSTTNMAGMFRGAVLFNQPIGNWDTSNVSNMGAVFSGAKAFNQDISNWNVEKVTTFHQVLNNSNMNPDNYDKLLNRWSSQNVWSDVLFGATGVYYCGAGQARSTLASTYRWEITDGGKNCPPWDLTLSDDEIFENTTEVGTVSALDEAATIRYSLVPGEGSEDNTKFSLDLTSGKLVFIKAPDFEKPTDIGDPDKENTYSIRVRATDATDLYSEEVFIITVLDVDDVAPVITIDAPTKMNENSITNTTFTVSDRFSIRDVVVDTSSVAAATGINCKPAPNASTTDINFPFVNTNPSPTNHLVLECTIEIISSGKLVLRAIDKAGYSSTKTEEGYVIDSLGPTFTVANVDITSPGNSLFSPTVRFNAVAPVGVKEYEIIYTENNGVEGTWDLEKTTQKVGHTGQLQQWKLDLDPDKDSHVVEIKAYSNANKATTRRITFPLEVTMTAPTIISNKTINDTKVTITTPNVGNEIGNIEFTGSASSSVSLGECRDSDGNIVTSSYTTSVTCEVLGIHNTGMLEIKATDLGTNMTGSNQQKYFYDTEAPTTTVSAPTKIKKDDIDDISITVTDNVEMYASSTSLVTDSTTASVTNWDCQICDIDRRKLNCAATVASSGDIVFRSTDQAGNTSTTTIAGFVVDRVAPVVVISTSTSIINNNNHTNYTLSGECTAGDDNLLVTIGEQPYVTACDAYGQWTLSADLSSYDDGAIAVTAQQADAVGNETTTNGSLLKDTIAPTISFINKITNVTSPQLIGLVNEATTTITITIDGNDYFADNKGDGTWELSAGQINALADGVYAVSITVLGQSGNTRNYYYPSGLTIDTVLPDVTIEQAPTQADPTNVNRAEFIVEFSKEIHGELLLASDFTITGSSGVVGLEKIDNRKFKAVVTNMTSGETVTLSLQANKVQDVAGNFNTASVSVDNQVTYRADNITVSENKPSGSGFRTRTKTDLWFDDLVHNVNTVAKNFNFSLPTFSTDSIWSPNKSITASGSSLFSSPKKFYLKDQYGNQGKSNIVNRAIIVVLDGSCQANVIKANSLKGNIKAPEQGVEIIGGLTYKLDCEKLGGDATVGVVLGEYYPNLDILRIYKKQDGELVDITKVVNLYNENKETRMTLTLIDGADYDEDGKPNYEILDPLYVGVYKESATTTSTDIAENEGCSWKFIVTILVVLMVVVIIFLVAKKERQNKRR